MTCYPVQLYSFVNRYFHPLGVSVCLTWHVVTTSTPASHLPYGRRKPSPVAKFASLYLYSCLLVCQFDLLPNSTVLVCQPVFPPLGCVSLPDLACCHNQHTSQSSSIREKKSQPSCQCVMVKGEILQHSKWTLCEFICLLVLSFCLCLLVCQLDLLPSSTVFVCQQVFPPLGCVSLPDLACCHNQHTSHKWVQLPCTQIWMCTVV